MTSTEIPQTPRELAWNRKLTARTNEYYHQERRRHWGMVAAWCRGVWGALVTIGCILLALILKSGLDALPTWFLLSAEAMAVAGLAALNLRPERRVETHTMLAIRYHYHARDLDRIYATEDWGSLDGELQSLRETMAIEAEREGAPHHATLQAAQDRVEKELGIP